MAVWREGRRAVNLNMTEIKTKLLLFGITKLLQYMIRQSTIWYSHDARGHSHTQQHRWMDGWMNATGNNCTSHTTSNESFPAHNLHIKLHWATEKNTRRCQSMCLNFCKAESVLALCFPPCQSRRRCQSSANLQVSAREEEAGQKGYSPIQCFII